LLVISLLALAQAWWVVRRPELRAPSSPGTSRALVPPVALSVIFAVATLVALASPTAGLLVLVCLPLVQFVAVRLSRPPSE
jgi:hypothetical protein